MRFLILIAIISLLTVSCKKENDENAIKIDTSKPRIDKFLDITWRSSQEVVKERMIQRKGVNISPELSSPIRLFFKGGEYEGNDVLYWMFDFSDSGLYYVAVVFKGENDSELKIKKKYQSIKNSLEEKYGKPTKDLYYFDPPYENDGTRQLFSAIKSGKAHIEAWWEIQDVKVHLILAGPQKYSPTIMLRFENINPAKKTDTEKLLEF